MKIYLSGAISTHHSSGEIYKAMEWRNKLIQRLLDLNADMCTNKFDWFDPTHNFEENLKYGYQTIVDQNKHYLDKCDLMVINLEKIEHSPGSMFEIFYYYLNHKPVIAFGETCAIQQPHIWCSITEWFPSLNDIAKYLENMYYQ